MELIRTYLLGCTWCNASGFVPAKNFGMTTPLVEPCPVCQGSKIITVTEVLQEDINFRIGPEEIT